VFSRERDALFRQAENYAAGIAAVYCNIAARSRNLLACGKPLSLNLFCSQAAKLLSLERSKPIRAANAAEIVRCTMARLPLLGDQGPWQIALPVRALGGK
jgi:hypothetical protein